MAMSQILINRLIEQLEQMAERHQFISAQYLFSMLRIRSEEVKAQYSKVQGKISYASGINETSTLLPITGVIAMLQNGVETVQTNIGFVLAASGELCDETLEQFGDVNTLHSVLTDTFGEMDRNSEPFLLRDYYPFYVQAVKSRDLDVKPTIAQFGETLIGSGLFGMLNKTKYAYMNDKALSEQ